MTKTMAKAPVYVEAKCDNRQRPLRVRIGLKSTVRQVRCECGVLWDYSAWVLKVYQRVQPPAGAVTVHRVDFVKTVNVIQDVESRRG